MPVFGRFLSLLCIPWLGFSLTATAQDGLTYAGEVKPFLQKYCYDCHADGTNKGDLQLDQHTTEAQALADLPFWKHVREAITTQVMPPPKKKNQPSETERAKLASWIDQAIFHIDCSKPDPGRVTIRRLNRREYNYSVQDLFAISFQPADDFPPDDSGYGFDRIGDVLTLSPVLMEKYFIAAEQVVSKAIHHGPPPLRKDSISSKSFKPTTSDDQHKKDDTPKVMTTEFVIPEDGTYTLNVEVRISSFYPFTGELVCTTWLNDEKYEQRAFTNTPALTEQLSVTKQLTKGKHTLSYQLDPRGATPANKNNSINFTCGGAVVYGPSHRATYPKSHQLIFSRGSASDNPAERLSYARDIFQRYAERLFRQNVDEKFLDRLSKIAMDYTTKSNHTFE
jgi:hypothetical protein